MAGLANPSQPPHGSSAPARSHCRLSDSRLQYRAMKPKGIVYLVGAGPGDTGLLTLRGAELLGRADVVVYDALVNAELLRLAPTAAEIVFGGKRPKDKAIP